MVRPFIPRLALLLAAGATLAATVAVLVLTAARQPTTAGAAGAETVQVTGAALTGDQLGRGRTRVRVRLEHTQLPAGEPTSAPALWFVRTPGTHTFQLVATTRAHELAAGVLAASAIVAPPAASFTWRVCIEEPWRVVTAPGQPAAEAHCPRAAFALPRPVAALEYESQASGLPLPALPSASAIDAAAAFLDGRAGRTAFAVIDDQGHIAGLHVHEHFESASVVKVMFLVAYLRRLEDHHLDLRASDVRLLYPMIHFSDNSAASAVLGVVGLAAVARVAREAGMTDYAPGVGWWAYTQTSAIDQVRLFSMLGQLIPARFYGYARYLLSTIAPEHSWGIPPVARPRWQVFYKTGSLPSQGLFNEGALLQRGETTIAMAIFTDGDPSPEYGKETIEGVAARLLGGDR